MVKLHNKMRRYNRIDRLYNKFFNAAMKRATADPNADEETLYRLLMTATQEGTPLHEEYQEMAKKSHEIILTSTSVNEVLLFCGLFPQFRSQDWLAEKFLGCDSICLEHIFRFLEYAESWNRSSPLWGQFHELFMKFDVSLSKFKDYIRLFQNRAYTPEMEDFYFQCLPGEYSMRDMWNAHPQWRTKRLAETYANTTIYGLTLD